MRICYLFNSSIPSSVSSSLQVVKTCEGLIKLKNEVFLVTPNTGLKTNLKNYYGLRFKPTRVRLKYFKKFPQGLNYYLFSLFSIIKAFSLKPDIFITRNLFTLFILVILKKKVIIELHHDLSNEGKLISFLYNNFSILNSKYIIKIIAITKSVKNFLINDLKVFRKKIQIIPSASDLKVKFSLLKKKRKYKIGYFGSLEKSKGSKFIIEISKMDQSNDYYIYGGEKKVIDIMKKKSSNKNLYLHKHVPYKKLKHYIKKMDVLIMPSDNKILRSIGGVANISKYTSPLKLFDYLAAGKFLILSNLKVYNEIIRNKEHCIILSLKHSKWVKVLKNIKNDIQNINILKKKAYTLSKKYTYEKRAQQLLDGLK
tara:strand:- start:3810 stop:4916 length:1107 start_codon:yes stop_codon:yes gene_type:complete